MPSKIYQNREIWFENEPSGSPGLNSGKTQQKDSFVCRNKFSHKKDLLAKSIPN
jgi:hypothetical protein